MDRRQFLRAGIAAGGTAAFGGSLWRAALGATAAAGTSPYGGLAAANGHGLELPSGFTSRVIARSGSRVAGTTYVWHALPDGGATFSRAGGGWAYVSNSEAPTGTGGASTILFSESGAVERAYRILGGTTLNCSGGATPWRTWLSCEEVGRGRVLECDPFGRRAAVYRPALGRFKHEAAAVDPIRKAVYLTEDRPDGGFYRLRPSAWPSLSAGSLTALCRSSTGALVWRRVPDPSAAKVSARHQVAGMIRFNGGEGASYGFDRCYFTTKGDGRVWAYNAATNRLGVVYDDSTAGAAPPLTGVDAITISKARDLYVAEDAGNMEICIITPGATNRIVAPVVRLLGQPSSEITGLAVNPAGTRMYFSSQRGTDGRGITYEVSGPFRR
jgi:secreted PhoX family phosphatase